MSATNTTANYNLPIFVGTDKPAWLVDFNGAMNAIDAQMKINADNAANAASIAASALVKPVSAPADPQLVGINTAGNQANLDLGPGLKVSAGVLQAIDLSLSDTGNYDSFVLPTGISYAAGKIYKALNSDKSAGKVYGNLALNNAGAAVRPSIASNIVVKATGSAYTINTAGFSISANGEFSSVNLNVSASGAVSIEATLFANVRTTIYIFPCIYFFEDFGDTP